MSQPIRVGLVGANVARNGWAIRAHAPVIAAHDGFTLQAVATTRRETAKTAATTLGAAAAYASAEALIEDPAVDLVVVAVNVRDHASIVRGALAAGKHVLCEWPLGVDPAESANLALAVNGSLAAIGLQAREAPAVRHARRMLDDGYVGRLLSATLTVSDPTLGASRLPEAYAWTADRAGGVTMLTVPGCHALDAAMCLAGTLTSVSARVLTLTSDVTIAERETSIRRTSDDHVALTGITDRGALLVAHLQSGCPGAPGAVLELRGDEGMLRLSTVLPTQLQMSPLELSGTRSGAVPELLALPEATTRHVPAAVRGTTAENVAGVYGRIEDALKRGGEPPADFTHATALHRLAEAAERSEAESARECEARG